MQCTLCGRETPDGLMERHHLVPRSFKGRETIPVCIDCGNQVHTLFTNKELATSLDTVERLMAEPRMRAYLAWIAGKRQFGIRQRPGRSRRR